jgi:hypothetical protein
MDFPYLRVEKAIPYNQGTLLKLEINGDSLKFTRAIAKLKIASILVQGG